MWWLGIKKSNISTKTGGVSSLLVEIKTLGRKEVSGEFLSQGLDKYIFDTFL